LTGKPCQLLAIAKVRLHAEVGQRPLLSDLAVDGFRRDLSFLPFDIARPRRHDQLLDDDKRKLPLFQREREDRSADVHCPRVEAAGVEAARIVDRRGGLHVPLHLLQVFEIAPNDPVDPSAVLVAKLADAIEVRQATLHERRNLAGGDLPFRRETSDAAAHGDGRAVSVAVQSLAGKARFAARDRLLGFLADIPRDRTAFPAWALIKASTAAAMVALSW
jgi:hypothetical protein